MVMVVDEASSVDWTRIELEAERAKVKVLRLALNRIASWGEGPDVTLSFDDPNSARIAREALKSTEE